MRLLCVRQVPGRPRSRGYSGSGSQRASDNNNLIPNLQLAQRVVEGPLPPRRARGALARDVRASFGKLPPWPSAEQAGSLSEDDGNGKQKQHVFQLPSGTSFPGIVCFFPFVSSSKSVQFPLSAEIRLSLSGITVVVPHWKGRVGRARTRERRAARCKEVNDSGMDNGELTPPAAVWGGTSVCGPRRQPASNGSTTLREMIDVMFDNLLVGEWRRVRGKRCPFRLVAGKEKRGSHVVYQRARHATRASSRWKTWEK